MNTRLILVAAFALSLTSMACQPAAQEAASGALSAEDIAAIRDVAESFRQAMLASDWETATSLFIEDAVRQPPNEPMIVGRAAILASMEAEPVTFTQFSNAPLEIDGRGDLAYARGTYSLTATAEGMAEPITDKGKYLGVFRKQADGSWLAAADIWNSDLPLPAAPAYAEQGVKTVTPEALSWQPVEGNPALRIAVLYGNPDEAGHFVVRIKLPPSWADRPHTHGVMELVTVRSGMCYVAYGDALTREAAKKLSPGVFIAMPAGTKMRAFTGKDGCVVDVQGQGPLTTQYLDSQGN